MTRAQTLAGAMGLASWRARWTLSEYAAAATGGGALTSEGGGPRSNRSLDPLGLNELTVTDAVLAMLWRFGPTRAVYGVSATAESRHFGADIAIVDVAGKRILLYQAKLARLDGTDLSLKSGVPKKHVDLLTRGSVWVERTTYAVTGRLALYQTGHTPFLSNCAEWPFALLPCPWTLGFDGLWHLPVGPPSRIYYEEVLHGGCSPGGVLAAGVTRSQGRIRSVPFQQTWPWEFDLFHWQERIPGPLDPRPSGGDGGNGPDRYPQFTPYARSQDDGVQFSDASEFASQLHQALKLPAGHVLYVIAI